MTRWIVASLGLVLIACGFVVCSLQPAAGVQEDGTSTIGVIVFQDDDFFRGVLEGMRASASKHGVKLIEGNSLNNRELENNLIQSMIDRKVSAICISPLSPVGSVPILQKAHEAGIHVVTYNSSLEAAFPATFINVSPQELGRTTGTKAKLYIDEHLSEDVQVATLAFKAQLPDISDGRVNGFLKEIKQSNNVTIVAQQDGWLKEDAQEITLDILKANPDLDIIYAANEGGTIGAVNGIRASGRKDVVVFGTDVSSEVMALLNAGDGILQATTGQRPKAMGSQAVSSAVELLQGRTIAKHIAIPGESFEREVVP